MGQLSMIELHLIGPELCFRSRLSLSVPMRNFRAFLWGSARGVAGKVRDFPFLLTHLSRAKAQCSNRRLVGFL